MSADIYGWVVLGITVGGLFLLNLVLVGCEISLVRLRYTLKKESELNALKGERGVGLILENTERVARVVRFGIIVSNVGLGIVLFRFAGELGANSWLLGVLLAIGICAIYLFGELLPRGFAGAFPVRMLKATSPFVWIFIRIFSPLLRTLESMSNRILGFFGVEPASEVNLLDVEVQIRAMGEEESIASPLIQKILRNGMRMRELEVSDVLLPRNQVQYFDTDDSIDTNLAKAKATGHTRFPLCEGDLDHCSGIVHIKDIFRSNKNSKELQLTEIKRAIESVSEDEGLESVLKKLLREQVHMALVHDEFGGTVGIITLEKILEQLVGEIQDEFDTEEAEKVSAISETNFKVDGMTPLHDLEEKLGVVIENDEVSTFGGLITDELGRFPEDGEVFVISDPGLEVQIEEIDEKRIISAKVRVLPKGVVNGD